MLADDLTDVPIDVFGGYCPAIVPAQLPPGAANIAQDVMFPQAGVRTRGGLGAGVVFAGAAIPGGASINGLKTYLTPAGGQRLMIWDSVGDMFKENPQGTLNLINSRPYLNLYYESQTLFGREYQAFFNSLGGADIPRQYDDTNWDRVSQVGPGIAPAASDDSQQFTFTTASSATQLAAANINSISEVGNVVTVVTATSWGFGFVGESVVIAGAGVAGYNGTWKVASVISNVSFTYINGTTGLGPGGAAGTVASQAAKLKSDQSVGFLTQSNIVVGLTVAVAGFGVAGYNGTWKIIGLGNWVNIISLIVFYVNTASTGLAASTSGTLTVSGNIAAGLHNVSVAFVTRQGLITAAAPWMSWTAAGSKRVTLANIATGPTNIAQRLLIFTPVITPPATTGTFYSLPNGSSQVAGAVMLIPDNVTTIYTVDFTDAILISGFNAEYLFSELELGEAAFMLPYNSRTVWLGERNKVPNFNNLTFDGGFNGNLPDGWTRDATSGAGGSSALAGALPADWGDAYVITGDGATAIRGKITQSAYQDFLQTAIVQANTSYSVRVRLRYAGTVPLQGTVHVNLNSGSGAFTTVGLAVAANTLTTSFQEFTAALTDTPLANPPADLLLQVYVDGTLTNGSQIIIDSIEPYPTATPFNASTARISRAFNPESFDSILSQVQIRSGDGQQLRAGFPLRNSLYLAKDHYLGYVTDDGVNEPASWTFTEVSATVGICGPNAVDWNEEWAVFAERSGFYVCWGSDPVKITPEIQTDATNTGRTSWASINWNAATTIWVRIDKINKMILIGAPINGATSPNVVFMLDYQWLSNAEDIAASPLVTYSQFTGKMLGHGRGRRWAVWNISANSMCFAERADGTSQPFFGGVGNGTVFQQKDVSLQGSDNGVAINSQYQGYPTPSSMEEQQYQLRAHRKLLGYLKFRALGSGMLNLAITTAQRSTILRGYALSLNPAGDGERPVNAHGERFFLTVSTNAVNSWFQLEKWIPAMKKDSSALVRGVSA
jgi:delta endotoxin